MYCLENSNRNVFKEDFTKFLALETNLHVCWKMLLKWSMIASDVGRIID